MELNHIRYEDIPENNKVENIVKELQLQENKDYKIELLVKIRDRNYTIATAEFNTKEGEIKGISTEEEYKEIQPEGNYIVYFCAIFICFYIIIICYYFISFIF